MANLKSSKKRAKQAIKRRQKNLNRKTAIKSAIKKLERALEASEPKETAVALLKDVEAKLARAKGKRVMHAKTASRKISNLAKKVAAAYRG